MEHDGFLRRDDSSSDPEMDFESYLSKKVEECISRPVSEMNEVEIVEIPVDEIPVETSESFSLLQSTPRAEDVEDRSSCVVESQTPEIVSQHGLPSAQNVDERQTELVIRGVEGHKYLTEKTKPAEIDPESIKVMQMTYDHPEKTVEILVEEVLKKVFTTRFDVLTALPEQIITHYHSLDRVVPLIRMMQQGHRTRLFDLLQAETAERRAELLELDSKFKIKSSRKASAKSAKSTVTQATGLNAKQRKAIDTLISLSASKDMILDKLRTMELLDSTTLAYVEKLFA